MAIGGASAALGVLVLLGWALGISLLKSVGPGLPPMKAATAIAIICAGGATICLSAGTSRELRTLGVVLGLVVAAIGAVVCVEYLRGPLGIDQLLFRDPASEYPGRPSQHTAVSLLALGVVLAGLGVRRLPSWLEQALVGVSATIVLFGIVGYVFGVDYLRGASGRSGIAVHTLFALAALTAGTMLLRPERGLLELLRGTDAGARVARTLLPLAVVAPLVVGGIVFVLQSDAVFGLRIAHSVYTLGMVLVLATVVVFVAVRARLADAQLAELAAIVEASADAIVTNTPEGIIRQWNAGAEKVYGYTAVEAVGRPISILAPPDGSEKLQRAIDRAGSGRASQLDTRRRRADGSLIDEALTVSPVFDRSGRVMAISTIGKDITERVRAQRAELAAEKRFRELLETAPDAMVITDAHGRIVLVNRRAEEMFGFARAELVGEPVETLVPEHSRARHARRSEAFFADPEARPMGLGRDLVARRRDGSRFPVEISLGPLQTEQGLLVSSAIRDVTERRRAAQALVEAEERFRSAFEEAPIGMVLLDLDGRFAKVNQSFCEIVGHSVEQLEGISFASITHPDDLERDREGLRAMRAGERSSYSVEKRYLHASGHPVHAAVQATILRDADGRPQSFLAQVQDVTDRRLHEQQLEYLADHDVLTGLFNRRAFNRELEAHAAMVKRYGPAGAVMVIDLDQFKFVNDTLGHQAGDELIVRASNVLAERLRTTDLLARLGGDEFGVLLPRTDGETAMRVAESLLQALRAEGIAVGGLDRRITASIGIACFDDQPDMGGEDVLVNADLAMYDAKEDGRDRAMMYSTAEYAQARMKGRITWAHRIQDALDRDAFELLAQPIVELSTGLVSKYEMLLRMRDDHGDLIPPSAFLYVAERLNLIQRIDAWVVRNAVDVLRELSVAHKDLTIAINVSAASLGDRKLLEHIQQVLADSGVDPRQLIFEITETAALANVNAARAFGEQLTEIGCRLALDDFGAGFGSFYYLKHLRFDLVKIDGEFVRGCTSSGTDQLLIRSMVDIARGLGKQTVAEFVGDDETAVLLRRLGVDFGQGYHLGKPARLGDLLRLRERGSGPIEAGEASEVEAHAGRPARGA